MIMRIRTVLFAAALGSILIGGSATAQTPAPSAAAAAPKAAAPGAAKRPATNARHAYDRRLDEIRTRGEIVVGVSRIAPWAIKDPQLGWLGFEIDVARQLAADLGVTLKIVEIPFPRLLEAVRNGDVDVAASGISITPRRALLVAFSQPYGQSKLELLVRKQDVARTDWNNADVVLGARAGTTAEVAAAEQFPLARTVSFDTDAEMFGALDNGKVVGVLAFAPQPQIRMAIRPDTVAVAAGADRLANAVDGFAVRKGEPSLVNFLDAWITYWKADGWLETTRQQWFGSVDWVTRLSQP
jgi:polar amino acid transport system substrate-binding protein